VSEWGDMSI